jgi:hypothetical protein
MIVYEKADSISFPEIAGDGMYAVGIVWSLMTWGFAV